MKAPRFTIRSLLILVALVALLIEANMLWSRSRQYRAKALSHTSQQRQHARIAAEDIKLADSAIGLNDRKIAETTEKVRQAKADIEKNEAFAKAHANSEIDSKFAVMRRTLDELSLQSHLTHLKMLEQDRDFNMQATARIREEAKHKARLAQYHAALARKYRRAASRPWFGVSADPPMPTTDP